MSQFPPRAFIRMAAEIDRAENRPPLPSARRQPSRGRLRFLSLQDVLNRLPISRSLLYELMKDPIQPFPAPIHIRRRSVWLEEDVDSYMLAVLETARQRLAN